VGPAQVRARLACGAGRTLVWLLLACVLSYGAMARAHFQDFMARIVHVVPHDGALRVYVQMPLAMVLLPHDWTVGGDQPPPHFLDTDERGQLVVDGAALRRDTRLLQARLGRALQIDGAYGSLEGARIDTLAARDPFTYLPAIERNVGDGVTVYDDVSVDLADAVVSMRLRFPRPLPGVQSVLSGSPLEWPDLAERAVNIVRIHREDSSVGSHQSVGSLSSTFDIEAARAATAGGGGAQAAEPQPGFLNYIEGGIHHVLGGLDHVLFILLLVLGASSVAQFARTSLAFTLGHSITLCAGAFGGLNALAWFAPGVEVAIAASIVYAGWRVLRASERALLAPVVFCVGLVHGFGFSFALTDAASSLAGNLAGLIVGFNLGIELGQIALSLVAAPLLWLLRRYWRSPHFANGRVLALPCSVVASFWVVERGVALAQALP
tara:strand:- start:34968 stop:36275 length:1308 start_codon:yes stop_codon:yes gene_type:complete